HVRCKPSCLLCKQTSPDRGRKGKGFLLRNRTNLLKRFQCADRIHRRDKLGLRPFCPAMTTVGQHSLWIHSVGSRSTQYQVASPKVIWSSAPSRESSKACLEPTGSGTKMKTIGIVAVKSCRRSAQPRRACNDR